MKLGLNPIFLYDDIFIIADVAGDNSKLKTIIKNLPLTKSSVIVFVGDLVNKGEDSLGVLETIRDIKNKVFIVEGNHDRFFLDFLNGEEYESGLDFLDSFHKKGLNDYKDIKKYLIKEKIFPLLDNMLPYFETKDLIVTHSPINKGPFIVEFDKNHPEGVLDRMYDSGEITFSYSHTESEEVTIDQYLVCGHQNKINVGLKLEQRDYPSLYKNRAFIDCSSKNNKLYCLHFPSKKIYSN